MENVEAMIRSKISTGKSYLTPSGRGSFHVEFTGQNLVLYLGKQETLTKISWRWLSDSVESLAGKGWVEIGMTYSTDSAPGTFDAFWKHRIKRAVAGWIAVILEEAGLVDLSRAHPARIRVKVAKT